MDLFAYAQIGDLEKIAKANGIEVPRLRGYRLMSDETPVSEAEINKIIQDCGVDVLVSGSYIFKAKNREKVINDLKA